MSIQAHADSDALSRAAARAGEPRRRRAVARSVQDRGDVYALAHREIERDAAKFYNRGGAIVGASVWFAFYVFAVIHPFLASGN